MGEQPALPGRLSVRAPMQWTPYDNGGSSTAPDTCLVRPILADGEYGFPRVNVAAQRADPNSLLNWMAGLIRTRRECGEIGAGRCRIVETGNDAILALRYDEAESAIIVLNNLSRGRHTVTLDLSEGEIATATDLFADRQYEAIDAQSRRVRLNGFGYRWMRLGGVY
jgi:maltose alpha-D-glucosyltransferase/alpha-amylase